MILPLFLFLGCFSFGPAQLQQERIIPFICQPVHCPRLLHADIPLYPPVAWSAHFGGKVEIEVHVKDGIVKQSKVNHVSIIPMGNSQKKEFTAAEQEKILSYLTSPALENLNSWRFQPEENTVFVVTFLYEIEGVETQVPENPRIEWDLPLIKVIAKPIKPTSNPQSK